MSVYTAFDEYSSNKLLGWRSSWGQIFAAW